jgi:hypothetical protein
VFSREREHATRVQVIGPRMVLRMGVLLLLLVVTANGGGGGGGGRPTPVDDSVFDPIQMIEQQAASVAQEQREFIKSQIWHTAQEACPEVGAACENNPACVTEAGLLVDNELRPNETNSDEVHALHTCVSKATAKAQAARDAASPKQSKEEERKQRKAFHSQLWQRASTECPKEAKLCKADKACTAEVYQMAMDDKEPDAESSEKVLTLHHCFLTGANRESEHTDAAQEPSGGDSTVNTAPDAEKCAATDSKTQKQKLAQPPAELTLDLHGSDYSSADSTQKERPAKMATDRDENNARGELSTSAQDRQGEIQEHKEEQWEEVMERVGGGGGDYTGGGGESNDSAAELSQQQVEQRFQRTTEAIMRQYNNNYPQLLEQVDEHFEHPLGDPPEDKDTEYLTYPEQRVHDLFNFLFYSIAENSDDGNAASTAFVDSLAQTFLKSSAVAEEETEESLEETNSDSVDNDDDDAEDEPTDEERQAILVDSIFERAKSDCPEVGLACSSDKACIAEVIQHATLDSTPDTRSMFM